MIKIRTRPINTRPARGSTELSRMSSMRAALNSGYCMRAQIFGKDTSEVGECPPARWREEFSYQEGQHRVVSDNQREKINGKSRLRLPEEVKITKTKNGKRWATSSMEIELAKDILEVRDGLGKIVDSALLK